MGPTARPGTPDLTSSPEPEAETVGSPTAIACDDVAVNGGFRSSGLRYVALEELGRGNMGRVLRAYDPKLQREVALKEVRRDRLDNEASARLVAEARAMAKLSHPHVVAIYDVEEPDPGKIVLVMECVRGQTLKDWLSEQPRDWRSAVLHFVAAGRGLHAAHEAGLLHRDFKPANVLVSERGVVKVTDFGIAKSSGSDSEDLDESTASADDLTEAGTVMGTPRYMAPEQHRGLSLTPAADQYALCVALWEALCAAPPFPGETIVEAKLQGPPKWPRADVPHRIVDAIVRGLAPRPEDRWPQLFSLLDVLSQEPPRHRGRWFLGIGGLVGVGAVGVSYGTWVDARARQCSGSGEKLADIWDDGRRSQIRDSFVAVDSEYARTAWTRTERALGDYGRRWVAMRTEACEATTVRGEQSAEMMDLRMGCLDRAAAALSSTTQVLAKADAQTIRNAHELTDGLPLLARCADSVALTADVEPPPASHANAVELARRGLADARSLIYAGKYDDARSALVASRQALSAVEYGPIETELAVVEASVLARLGEYEASRTKLEDALRIGARWRQWGEVQQAAVQWMDVVGSRLRQMDAALQLRALTEGLSHASPLAEAGYRGTLGGILSHLERSEEAEAETRASLALRLAAVGSEHPSVATARQNLGIVLQSQGRYAEAEEQQRMSLALRIVVLGADHPLVADSRNALASVLTDRGQAAEAEVELRAALRLREDALGPEHPDVGIAQQDLAAVLTDQGRYPEAEASYRAALRVMGATLGVDHPDTAGVHVNLGTLLANMDRLPESEHEFRTAIGVLEDALGADHPVIAIPRNNLADLLEALGRPAEALPLAEAAWQTRSQHDGPPSYKAGTAFILARILWTVDPPKADRRRARQLAQTALEGYLEAGEVFEVQSDEVRVWLEAHQTP